LLLSELVTNAVVHAGTDVEVRLTSNEGVLRVEVSDGNPRLPAARRPSALAGTGRGLHLVQALASSWGVVPVAGGKMVWFEVGIAMHSADRRALQLRCGDSLH
jgi:anti-sigma regulatory factor (Ser/Thr protein kinase)